MPIRFALAVVALLVASWLGSVSAPKVAASCSPDPSCDWQALVDAPLDENRSKDIPEFVREDTGQVYRVEVRRVAKAGNYCDGETIAEYTKPQTMGTIVLRAGMDAGRMRWTLWHEVSHPMLWEEGKYGKCMALTEDQAIELLAPHWTKVHHDPFNRQLNEYLGAQ